jgi:uncharacterized protein (TIGR03084 family)
MVDLESLLTDLADESAELDAMVAARTSAEWAQPTPAPGWTIAHQIAHLSWTDHVALLAMTDVGAFFASVSGAADDPTGFVDRGAAEFLASQAELLQRWRAGRAALAEALTALPPGVKIPWYGTQMSATSMATGRIMETWAHGQDVADTLGVSRTPTARLRHVVHLGIRTLGHGFTTHGRAAPDSPVRVELVAPPAAGSGIGSGPEVWVYGPADSANVVSGPALDFCLLVTQRRHRADLALVATGPIAQEWLDVAQAFAGPAGAGREPSKAPS